MSTNYFLVAETPLGDKRIHVGKLSSGWRFTFHGYWEFDGPADLTTFDEWQRYITKMVETSVFPGVTLEDEYGNVVEPVTLFDDIVAASDRKRHENDDEARPGYQSDPSEPADFLFAYFS